MDTVIATERFGHFTTWIQGITQAKGDPTTLHGSRLRMSACPSMDWISASRTHRSAESAKSP